MSEQTINQRLKFLIEKLSVSVRAFSEAIGDSSSNTQNYVGARKVEPKPEYLAKVINHFSNVNAHWLLTGHGEPFHPSTLENNPSPPSEQFFFGSQITGKSKGAISQHQNIHKAQPEDLANKLAAAEKEIESLRAQLTLQANLIAAKDETITLLRTAFTRHN